MIQNDINYLHKWMDQLVKIDVHRARELFRTVKLE